MFKLSPSARELVDGNCSNANETAGTPIRVPYRTVSHPPGTGADANTHTHLMKYSVR